MKLKCDDVIIQWMIRWAVMMVSRYVVGKDGITSYERRRGRACRAPVATCGKRVWYKQIREQKERKDKIELEWHEGPRLGQSRSTDETIVGNCRRSSSSICDERWKGDLIKKLQGTVARPDPNWGQHVMRGTISFVC